MEIDVLKLAISHCLDQHPVLNESLKYKIKYLNVLEYFVLKYSRNDCFACAMFENYRKCFLLNDLGKYSYNKQELKLATKGVTGAKFKGFKLFTYRYSLLCDCLFINAFNDYDGAVRIFNEIKSIYRKRYLEKLDILFSTLYDEGRQSSDNIDKVQYQVECWLQNRRYLNQNQITVMTTATMSAGKSTLINTLIGKSVNKTMNDACTAKLHIILDKAFEDGFNYEYDYELNLNASHEVLMDDDTKNQGHDIYAATFFRIFSKMENRLCIIDTPGINSSLNKDHANVTKQGIVSQNFDKLVYIINAENAGTDDDLKYLQFLSDKVDKSKFIFVLNKLDKFRKNEDSVLESVKNVELDLKKLGFDNPIICPVSSYAGLLAKKKIFEEILTDEELDDFEFLSRKFKKPEYDLSVYYSGVTLIDVEQVKNQYIAKFPKEIDLLLRCGMLCFENIIFRGE